MRHTTLEAAVLAELADGGRPVPAELRRLARDRADRAEEAMDHVGGWCTWEGYEKAAPRLAQLVREEHAAGVKARRQGR